MSKAVKNIHISISCNESCHVLSLFCVNIYEFYEMHFIIFQVYKIRQLCCVSKSWNTPTAGEMDVKDSDPMMGH